MRVEGWQASLIEKETAGHRPDGVDGTTAIHGSFYTTDRGNSMNKDPKAKQEVVSGNGKLRWNSNGREGQRQWKASRLLRHIMYVRGQSIL